MPERHSAARTPRQPIRPALSAPVPGPAVPPAPAVPVAGTAAASPARGRSARGWLRSVTLLIVGTLVVLSIGLWAAPSPSGTGGQQDRSGGPLGPLGPGVAAASGEVSETSWGPLSATDGDLLVRVRLAGLWEQPSGEMAQTHSSDQRVRLVGQVLAADHRRLDEQVRQAARKLQVVLPEQPNADQQGWLDELAGKRNRDFDVAFANRLRVAHGRVFGVVAEVRSTTRNSLVRSFAQTAVDVVMKHMSLLESTGLVAPEEAAVLTPPAPRGPVTVPLVVTVVALVAVANLAVAARRSWS
jgi:predicted outer membrane protein